MPMTRLMIHALIALLAALLLAACSDDGNSLVDAAIDGGGRDASVDLPRPDAGPAADVTIKPDVFVPFALTLTVNQIPAAMNVE